MDTTKAQQIALDDALVAPTNRLKIGKCNHRLSSDLKSNEPTIQVATVSTHRHSLYFKINGRSHTLNVENFRYMLHICLRLPSQRFGDPPLKEEILSFIRDLGHTKEIKVPTDVNVNYMHQPWRSFVVIINRDDLMFNTIRVISRHQDIRICGAILPAALNNQKMLDSKAYKEYYAVASGAEPPKAKTKYKKKADESVTSPKSKTASSSKVQMKELVLYQGVPDVPSYKSESDKKYWRDSEDEDNNDDNGDNDDGDNDDDNDDDAESDDHDNERTEFDSDEILDPKLTNKQWMMKKMMMRFLKLYEDVNVNLEKGDAEMTDANQRGSEQQNVSQESGFKQEEEDAHVTLTSVFDAQKADEPVQSSSISSDFTSKFLNLENPSLADNEIASLMETSTPHATVILKITFAFTTTTPPSPLFFSPPLQQQTPTIPTLTFTTITPTHLTVTLPEIPNFASVFKFDQRVDSTMKKIIKDQVKEQVSKMMPKIEKYVTETLGAKVLVRTTDQPQTAYAVTVSLLEFELKKILIDKMEANKSDTQKNSYNALVESYNSNKDIITSYCDVVLLKRGQDDQDNDEDPSPGSDRGMKSKKSGKDAEPSKDSRHAARSRVHHGDNDEQPVDKDITKADWFKKPKRPLTPDPDWITRLTIMKKHDYGHLEEIELTKLTIDECYDLNVVLRMFTKRIVIQKRVEDLQLGIKSYQKKLNLTKPDTYISNIKNKTAYTSHSDPHGIIYVDSFKRKRLMHTDELYKFGDATLNDARTALHDIATGIRMEYLPMRKWSNLDKKRARVMVQEIDKQLYQRRLMQNLEKFIGERPYGEDLRLLERTI
uniref:Uncharacterized protein n=1 Tax=Tanacetum cinerariifolium TaxID=118510 RepID=A0A6L2L8D5_TANCI|nr:hypothetical protein [Tanacetum cinerariifolium]